jgi:hypothetical protein
MYNLLKKSITEHFVIYESCVTLSVNNYNFIDQLIVVTVKRCVLFKVKTEFLSIN